MGWKKRPFLGADTPGRPPRAAAGTGAPEPPGATRSADGREHGEDGPLPRQPQTGAGRVPRRASRDGRSGVDPAPFAPPGVPEGTARPALNRPFSRPPRVGRHLSRFHGRRIGPARRRGQALQESTVSDAAFNGRAPRLAAPPKVHGRCGIRHPTPPDMARPFNSPQPKPAWFRSRLERRSAHRHQDLMRHLRRAHQAEGTEAIARNLSERRRRRPHIRGAQGRPARRWHAVNRSLDAAYRAASRRRDASIRRALRRCVTITP